MAARKRTTSSGSLRSSLLDVLTDGLSIAERYATLGLDVTAAQRQRIDALTAGEPVTVAGWQLASALQGIDASAEARAVATGRAEHYVVNPDGGYTEALDLSGSRHAANDAAGR